MLRIWAVVTNSNHLQKTTSLGSKRVHPRKTQHRLLIDYIHKNYLSTTLSVYGK